MVPKAEIVHHLHHKAMKSEELPRHAPRIGEGLIGVSQQRIVGNSRKKVSAMSSVVLNTRKDTEQDEAAGQLSQPS